MWAVWVLFLWWAGHYWWSGRCDWPPVCLVARPCLVWNLLAAGEQGWIKRQLVAETQGVMRLVLAHWWAQPCSVVGGCAAKGPRYSVSLFVGGAGS